MGQNSKIEWTHHTVNLWWGCEEVHEGCDHCYAKAFSHRYDGWLDNPQENVMYGTSIVNLDTLLTLGTQMMKLKGKKFFSIEPQLDWVYLKGFIQNNENKPDIVYDFTSINWIIQGGESGHSKRPFDLNWAYSMRDQCIQYGIPYFFKQIDKIKDIPKDLLIRDFPIFNSV